MLAEGALAPDFELQLLAPGSVQSKGLRRDLLASGIPLLLAFFKVSCPVCQFAFPFLQRIAHGGHLRVAGISQDDLVGTSEFNDELGISFETLIDPRPYRVSSAYGITNVPSMFLVEPDGHISRSAVGFSKAAFVQFGERAALAPFRTGELIPAFRPG
jgi:peroxiredoxin